MIGDHDLRKREAIQWAVIALLLFLVWFNVLVTIVSILRLVKREIKLKQIQELQREQAQKIRTAKKSHKKKKIFRKKLSLLHIVRGNPFLSSSMKQTSEIIRQKIMEEQEEDSGIMD